MQNSHNNIDPIIHNQRVAPDLECYLGSNRVLNSRLSPVYDGRVTIAGITLGSQPMTVTIAGPIVGRDAR